jgi:hypothetical protein
LDLRAGATYQNLPGIPTTASYVAGVAEIQPTLGRPLAGSARSTIIELIAPNTLYRERRITQVNVRLARTFRIHRVRAEPQLDVHNLFNANSVLVISTRYGPAWQNATTILSPRVFKFGLQLDF